MNQWAHFVNPHFTMSAGFSRLECGFLPDHGEATGAVGCPGAVEAADSTGDED